MASFDQTPIIQIAKFLFEGLLRIWNSDYDIWSMGSTGWWDNFFGENGSFLARSVLELLKPDRLRRKRKKKTGKTIVHSKTVVLIKIVLSLHFIRSKIRVNDKILYMYKLWESFCSAKLFPTLVINYNSIARLRSNVYIDKPLCELCQVTQSDS